MSFSHYFQALKRKKVEKMEETYRYFFFFLSLATYMFLWEDCFPQEWDWWSAGSCGASYPLPLHWCLPAGAGQVSLKSKALDLQLTFQVDM